MVLLQFLTKLIKWVYEFNFHILTLVLKLKETHELNWGLESRKVSFLFTTILSESFDVLFLKRIIKDRFIYVNIIFLSIKSSCFINLNVKEYWKQIMSLKTHISLDSLYVKKKIWLWIRYFLKISGIGVIWLFLLLFLCLETSSTLIKSKTLSSR